MRQHSNVTEVTDRPSSYLGRMCYLTKKTLTCVCLYVCVCSIGASSSKPLQPQTHTSSCCSAPHPTVVWHQAGPSNFLTVGSTAGGRALNFAAGGISLNLRMVSPTERVCLQPDHTHTHITKLLFERSVKFFPSHIICKLLK